MFQTVPLSIISFSQDQDGTAVPSWSCSQAVNKPVWHIPLLCVQWKTPDDGHRNCPKHVEFYYQNKFEKLVHLVGFIIIIYHDARSPERQSVPKPRHIKLRRRGIAQRKNKALFSSFCNKYLLLNLAFRTRISDLFMKLIHIWVINF